KGSGDEKPLVLKKRSMVLASADRLGSPTRFGRHPPPSDCVEFVAQVTLSGGPLASVIRPPTCQPPMMLPMTLPRPRKRLPRPTGNCQIELATKRCGWSMLEIERSA